MFGFGEKKRALTIDDLKILERMREQGVPTDAELLAGKRGSPNTVTSIGSDALFREINLYIPELIAIVFALIGTIILVYITRFTLVDGFGAVTGGMPDDVYNSLSGTIQTVNLLVLLVGAAPLLVLTGFFLYRRMVFHPTSNKFPVARVKTTGGIRLSIDKLPQDKKLDFGKGFDANKMDVMNPRVHWIEGSGYPFLFLFEGDDSNANLNSLRRGITNKGQDTNAVNAMMFHAGERWERYKQERNKGFFTNTNILLILILVGVAVIAFLVLRQPDVIAGMMGG